MKYKDYYEQLGVERDATETDIKRAYRRLARKYHPDVSKASDAEERFKEIGEAYAVLKDTEKRAAYDQLGADWQSGQDFSPPPEWDAGFEFSGGGANFSDFFDSLFSNTGGGFRQHADPHVTRANRPIRGEDHHAKVLIDLEDAFNGSTRAFTLRTPQVTSDGHVTLKERTLNVKIPKGVKTGQQIRLSGQGAPGLGDNQAGDLYLEVEFKPHRLYTIEDSNIFLDLPIAPWEAALGATVKTPTPGGSIDLKIPPGTSHGRKLRLKGRGIPGKPPGDLFVNPVITVPPADSDEAKALYKQMREQLSFDPRATLGV